MDMNSTITGISNSILRPKLNHQFLVRFLVHARVSEDQAKEIEKHVNALSMQTISVKLPTRNLGGSQPVIGEGLLKNVKMDGALTITFEDDILSSAVEALEWLASNPALTILVLKMDGGDKVYNAYRFTGSSLAAYEHSMLDYGGAGTMRAYGTITSVVDNEPQTASINLSSDGHGQTCQYTAKFNFKSAQFNSFSTPIEVKDLF